MSILAVLHDMIVLWLRSDPQVRSVQRDLQLLSRLARDPDSHKITKCTGNYFVNFFFLGVVLFLSGIHCRVGYCEHVGVSLVLNYVILTNRQGFFFPFSSAPFS